MNKEERMKLIRALIAASNAFRDELKKHGYYVGYGLDDSKTGDIYKINRSAHDPWPLGNLTITWKL